jgi:hypothetical protein
VPNQSNRKKNGNILLHITFKETNELTIFVPAIPGSDSERVKHQFKYHYQTTGEFSVVNEKN